MSAPSHSVEIPAAAAGGSPIYRHGLRVYWEDTDAGGIVFYANTLKFFERARTEWLRHLGFSQEALRHDPGVVFVVTETAVQYRSPARLDDWLTVTVEIRRAGAASLEIDQTATVGERRIAEGRIRVGCVDAATLRPCRLPLGVLQALRAWMPPPPPSPLVLPPSA